MDSEEQILVVLDTPSRLSCPTKAYGMWSRLYDADREASRNRAKVDAMVDGEPPFDQSLLDESGQSDAANFNTRESSSQVSQVCAAYYDLVTSNKSLVTLKCEYGDALSQSTTSKVIAEEFTNLVRRWDSFEYWYNVMVKQHVTHGIGVCFFPDETDWRFKSCGLADFKLPRDCPATEEAIPLAAALIPTDITDLYNAISSSEGLDCCHWDIDKLKKLVMEASKDLLTDSTRMYWDNWEYIEKQIKENSLYFGSTASSRIWLIHFWIKEEDGSISHGILPKDDTTPVSWLYFNKSRFESIKEAFIIFPYDLGSGTYHTVRGLGYIIQPQVQANNALTCRMADGAMASTMNLLKITTANQTELERMAVAHFGNNEVLPPGLEYVERRLPDYTNTVLPVINFMQNQLRQNNLGARPQIPALDKNAPAIAHQLEAQNNAAISASALNRFYTQLDKLFSEMFRRAINPAYLDSDPAGKQIIEFRKRLKKRNIPLAALDYVVDVKATRSVGAGSASNRLLSYNRLQTLQGSFDPEGRRNLAEDIVSEEVGYENVDRYMQPLLASEQRAPIDVKVAEFENLKFELGKQSPVLPNQDHFTHINVHVPLMAQVMDALAQKGETAQMPEMTQTFTLMMSALPHCAEHINIMSTDVSRRQEVKSAMQLIQQLQAGSDRLRNQIVRLQQAQQQQAQAEMERQQQAQAAYVADLEAKVKQGGPDASAAQSKLIDAQIKNQIREMEFKQKMEQRQLEFNQKMALRDAESAARMVDKAQAKTEQ